MARSGAALADRIRSDFAAIPYPGDHWIVWRCDCEGRGVGAFFKGRHWQSIDVKALRNGLLCDEAMGLDCLTPGAFRYYLPAFLLISIESYGQAELIPDATIRALTPDDHYPNGRQWFDERVDPLSFAQKHDIALFLRHMARRHFSDGLADGDPKLALDLYWHQFEKLPPRNALRSQVARSG